MRLSASSWLVVGAVSFALLALVLAGMSARQPGQTPDAGAVATVAGPSSSAEQPAATPSDFPGTTPSAATGAAHSSFRPTPKPTAGPASRPGDGCAPTDQDRYVYHPSRLAVRTACIHVTGTVAAIRTEADGDLHILLALDPSYTRLLTPANQGEELGDLVVEPVCVHAVGQADAIQVCASDPDPLRGPFPSVGERVWMEGRYVLDLDHGGWAELHPLYRWGSQ